MRLPLENLKHLLSSHGWEIEAKSDFSQHLFLFSNSQHPDRELALPINEDAPDYNDAVHSLLSKLAKLENQSIENLAREAEIAGEGHLPRSSDNLVLRVIKPSEDGDAIPLTLARTMLSETEVLIMAGSCQADKPQHFYRRIDNKTSTSLLERAVFNHTRHGSFVLTVSCPVLAHGEQIPLGLNRSNFPQTRKAFLALHTCVNQLQKAISENKLGQLAEDNLHSKVPTISSNLVEAIGSIAASDTGGGIEFDFGWSKLVQIPDTLGSTKELPFFKPDAVQLFEVAAKLRPQEAPQTSRFIGTVEALRGNLTDDQIRAGWVELSLLHPAFGLIRAAAELNPDLYRLADKAHIGGAQFVAITGTVEPRARVWIFSKVEGFEYIETP